MYRTGAESQACRVATAWATLALAISWMAWLGTVAAAEGADGVPAIPTTEAAPVPAPALELVVNLLFEGIAEPPADAEIQMGVEFSGLQWMDRRLAGRKANWPVTQRQVHIPLPKEAATAGLRVRLTAVRSDRFPFAGSLVIGIPPGQKAAAAAGAYTLPLRRVEKMTQRFQVVDETGAPVAGAALYLQMQLPERNGSEAQVSPRTDDKGETELKLWRDAKGGLVKVLAGQPPGFRSPPEDAGWKLPAGAQAVDTIQMVVCREHLTVRGKLKIHAAPATAATAGTAVEQAPPPELPMRRVDLQIYREATDDPAAVVAVRWTAEHFELYDYAPGKYVVRLEPNSESEAAYRLVSGEQLTITADRDKTQPIEHTLVLEKQPVVPLKVKVVYEDGTTPVESAYVCLRRGPVDFQRTYADQDGRAEFTDVPVGNYTLWVGRPYTMGQELKIDHQDRAERTVKLERYYALWVTLTDADGKPVQGELSAVWNQHDPAVPMSLTQTDATDENGLTRLDVWVGDELTFKARRPGYPALTQTITVKQSTRMQVQFPDLPALKGRVTNLDLTAAPQAALYRGVDTEPLVETPIDAEGRYRLHAPVGEYRLVVRWRNGQSTTLGTVTLAAGGAQNSREDALPLSPVKVEIE